MARREDLYKELEHDISRRKRSEGAFFKPKKVQKMEYDQDIKEVVEEKRGGFFSKLFGSSKIEEMPEIKVDASAEDLKEIAKITLKALKMLPPEQITAFKNTEDYSKLKEILKKHNMIK